MVICSLYVPLRLVHASTVGPGRTIPGTRGWPGILTSEVRQGCSAVHRGSTEGKEAS